MYFDSTDLCSIFVFGLIESPVWLKDYFNSNIYLCAYVLKKPGIDGTDFIMVMSSSFSFFFDYVPCTGMCKTVLLHYFCWRKNFMLYIHPSSILPLLVIKHEIPHLSIPCCLAMGIVLVFILSCLNTKERCWLFVYFSAFCQHNHLFCISSSPGTYFLGYIFPFSITDCVCFLKVTSIKHSGTKVLLAGLI